ncbi:cob(I)yrinic acid a,c-diamide adenosyltransferase [Psychromonas antarctica]|jgi:cob(I)alamin adenosyltransferase|uniref:cob(I)yrinic acid a,c-diamide adenosyltransferase n=1 Tax=Psychromonas antarctica TaxID=67573 RepID=UPI001EE8ED71|nr:cob(I)yrinic acid a,c-diamide adenosyltransferase [Psychromonas antarctica]MCG6201163.1 cob(I)yrinic acid a,c-diamide adenosyltransferase [Psychromonas antarctica]
MSDAKHLKRMQAIKEKQDQKIAAADQERGVTILLAGPGKGKSSSAFGMLARSLGHGHKVAVVQFLKGSMSTGEELFFTAHENVDWFAMGDGFTWETQDKEQDIASAQKAWAKAEQLLADDQYQLVILDEVTYMFKFQYLQLEPTLKALKNRPEKMNVVLTGRGPTQELIDAVDTYSLILDEKHAFKAGVKAQAGIEW